MKTTKVKLKALLYPGAGLWTVVDENTGSAVASKVKSEREALLFALAPEMLEVIRRIESTSEYTDYPPLVMKEIDRILKILLDAKS